MEIKAAELPLDANGNVYHLNLQPEELAEKIILVGDPERVPFFSQGFDRIETKRKNREIVTHTGLWKGKRISVISTGMGTDNIDIVLNELDALVNIDLKKRRPKEKHTSLELVRIGTSGILQGDIPLHTWIAGRYAIGMDSLLHFYRHPALAPEEVVRDFTAQTEWGSDFPQPYAVSADAALWEKISEGCLPGITLTAPGFYGPQCRVLRLDTAQGDFIRRLQGRSCLGLPYANLEMETAGLYGMAQLLGHRALSISVGIANRVTGAFSENYRDAIMALFEHVMKHI
ncbi:MAG: nucleoside phosphorylase [Bacteroidales bacterium]|nr:nucleoside phosphorylase [Bacteroidales bacterium]